MIGLSIYLILPINLSTYRSNFFSATSPDKEKGLLADSDIEEDFEIELQEKVHRCAVGWRIFVFQLFLIGIPTLKS